MIAKKGQLLMVSQLKVKQDGQINVGGEGDVTVNKL